MFSLSVDSWRFLLMLHTENNHVKQTCLSKLYGCYKLFQWIIVVLINLGCLLRFPGINYYLENWHAFSVPNAFVFLIIIKNKNSIYIKGNLACSFKSTTSVLRMQKRNRRAMKMDIRNRNMFLDSIMWFILL